MSVVGLLHQMMARRGLLFGLRELSSGRNNHTVIAGTLQQIVETNNQDDKENDKMVCFISNSLQDKMRKESTWVAFADLIQSQHHDMSLVTDIKAKKLVTDTNNALHADVEKALKWDVASFFSLLHTQHLGHMFFYARCLPSTQTFLLKQVEVYRAGGGPSWQFMSPFNNVVCMAEEQSEGKGRGKNTWVSPMGCLMFSFQSVFHDGRTLPFVQYLVSLAIIRTIQRLVHNLMKDELPIKIKWPNDIYGENQKIGGVLCQSEYSQGHFVVTTGIGLNLLNEEPTTCVNKILKKMRPSIENEMLLTREVFLAAFCNEFEPMVNVFNEKGFDPYLDEYLAHWLHSNQAVQIQDPDVSSNLIDATIQGLTSSGCLLARSSTGDLHELYPDGNSFDFMHGLLGRKM